MAGVLKDAKGSACQFAESIRVTLRTTIGIKHFAVGRDCTVMQFKGCVAERLGTTTERLVLIHTGQILSGSERLSDHKGVDGMVNLYMFISASQDSLTTPTRNPASRTVRAVEDNRSHDDLTPSPTSPPPCLGLVPSNKAREPIVLRRWYHAVSLRHESPRLPVSVEKMAEFCVEELCSLGSSAHVPAFFEPLQRQMERQLLADPELLARVLGSPLVRDALSASNPQLTRQLLLSNPLTLQLLQMNPEAVDMLGDPEVIGQMVELSQIPNVIQEAMKDQDGGLADLEPAQNRPGANSGDLLQRINKDSNERHHSHLHVQTRGDKPVTSSAGESRPIRGKDQPLPVYRHSTETLTGMSATAVDRSTVCGGMQSLLEHICTCPGLMESLLSGPYVHSILDTLCQNEDLAAQMLLSHPMFAENPQLQQQIREQLPLFLQQMQSPELLAAFLNPRAMEALLQIQHGLQTLTSEIPALTPCADLESIGTSIHPDPHTDIYMQDQPGNNPQVAMVTEQQQKQFVQQMLQMLANTNQQSPD